MSDSGFEAPVRRRAEPPITQQEHTLRRWTAIWALISVFPGGYYLYEAFAGDEAARAFAVNSFAKEMSWIVLAIVVYSNVRKFSRLVTVVVLGHVAIILVLVSLIVGQRAASTYPEFGPIDLSPDWRLAAWLVLALAAAALLLPLQIRARRSVLGLKYFWPLQHETLVALAEVAIERPRVPAGEVARRVDAYWAGFQLRDRGRARLALLLLYVWPIFTLQAPFPLMDHDRRKQFIRKRFVDDLIAHRVWALWRPLIRTTIRFTLQMVSMGYYSDPRSRADTGYVAFAERSSPGDRMRPRLPALQTIPPHEVPRAMEADVVIVGTGAAAGILAHELVEQGKDVLMLERGAHVRSEDFTEGELDQYAALYRDGALQLSRDFRFQVLQGMCVGGSTTVNNGVCFDLAPETLELWNGPYAAGLEPGGLAASFTAVRDLLQVHEIHGAAVGAGALRLVEGIRELKLDEPPNTFGRLETNLQDCLGCGLCNIGCAFGRKQSMLDKVLPEAQQTKSAGSLRVLPLTDVFRVDEGTAARDGRAQVVGVTARTGPDRRPLTVRAPAVIVAAGAIGSSRLLQESGIGGVRVGRGLCANLGAFMTGDFTEKPVRGMAGVQQTHYVEFPRENYLLETWFNPVVTQALVMPGWLDQHEANMARYDHMTCMGALIGTMPRKGNRVHKPGPLGGEFSLAPATDELERVVAALKQAGRVLFASGAERVMPATFRYREYRNEHELDDLDDLLRDRDDLSLQTAHPQGGNPISSDPQRGIVDEDFRVHGYANLFVCDASVFPTATQRPPQLTVMALAHYAAHRPGGIAAVG